MNGEAWGQQLWSWEAGQLAFLQPHAVHQEVLTYNDIPLLSSTHSLIFYLSLSPSPPPLSLSLSLPLFFSHFVHLLLL